MEISDWIRSNWRFRIFGWMKLEHINGELVNRLVAS